MTKSRFYFGVWASAFVPGLSALALLMVCG